MAVLSFLTYLRGIYQTNLAEGSRVHYAIIQSIYDTFVMAKTDIDYARLEMSLATATDDWLDTWGEYFSVFRKSGEEDDVYRQRIIDSVIQPKSTIPAIKDALVDYLNAEYNKNYTREDILIREPWKDIAKYSHKGKLSDDALFFSKDYYTHAVIDISIPEEVTQEVIDLVNSVKAAGVKAIWSVLNSYDIVSGFADVDEAWAAYSRWMKTQTKRNQYSGLVLSNSSPNPVLSGAQETWGWMTSTYYWYAKVIDKQTDDSIIITKRDIMGMLDYFVRIEEELIPELEQALSVSNTGELNVKAISGKYTRRKVNEIIVEVTDEMVNSLELLDKMLHLSKNGKLSTSEGMLFENTAEHQLYVELLEQLQRFKADNPDYYNALQPPILNGERVMWLIKRNKNWIWNTPTITYEDFLTLWEPFNIQSDMTLKDILEYEASTGDAYGTFGDLYQPPIVVGDKFLWTTRNVQACVFDSPVFLDEDLQAIFSRQLDRVYGQSESTNVTLGAAESLEKTHYERYSVIREVQPPIQILSDIV